MIDWLLKIGCRMILGMASGLAVMAVYSPALGHIAAGLVMLVDMWVSDIVTALRERNGI